MKKIIGFISLALVLVGIACSSRRAGSIPIETLTVTPIVELSSLKPSITEFPFGLTNPFSLDEHNNIYLLDMSGHRILKYDQKGVFLAQIGSIGQTKECLFNPVGLCVSKEFLYVLNEGGLELKIFSTNGEYRSLFRIENARHSNSICVIEDLIYINVTGNIQLKENISGLISVYSEDGRLVKKMGKIVKSNSFIGYSVFNEIIMTAADHRLFWAFSNIPLISGEDLEEEGRRDFLDLRALGIPEITAKSERAKAQGADSPETIKPDTELQIKYIIYCEGFGIDGKRRMYYVIHEYPDGPGLGSFKCHLLVIDKNGRIDKKINLQHEGGNLKVSHLLFGPGNLRCGLGQIKGKTLLFNF